MDDQEIKARKDFYAVNGKTPEQEAENSTAALGWMNVTCLVVFAAIGFGIYKSFFAYN